MPTQFVLAGVVIARHNRLSQQGLLLVLDVVHRLGILLLPHPVHVRAIQVSDVPVVELNLDAVVGERSQHLARRVAEHILWVEGYHIILGLKYYTGSP